MNVPLDPVTDLTAVAVQLHELYSAFVDAGFTADQALELTKAALPPGH